MVNEEDAKKAIEQLNGSNIHGRHISVEVLMFPTCRIYFVCLVVFALLNCLNCRFLGGIMIAVVVAEEVVVAGGTLEEGQ